MAPISIPSMPVAPGTSIKELLTITESYDETLRFYLNGTGVALDSPDPEVTLLEYLRGIGLTGTKLGCAEGGCGACTVIVSRYCPIKKEIYHASINSCLSPLISVDGKHIITIEGIGNTKRPHTVQRQIAEGNGSQCGFCTPGIVMSLYALIRNDPTPSEKDVEEAFDGNLCRCTGYRSILDAAQTFSTQSRCGKTDPCNGYCCKIIESQNDRRERYFLRPKLIEKNADTELIFPPTLTKHKFRPLKFGNKRKTWYRPVTLKQLLELKNAYPSAKIIGGSTETQIEIYFKSRQYEISIYVGDIQELKAFSFEANYLEIGGNLTLTDLESVTIQALEHYGVVKGQVFAAIHKQLKYFAGRQIKNVGTPAGNLATASPISDLNPVLVASDSTVVIKSLKKQTEIKISQFFTGYRTTALPQDAIIFSIRIPVTDLNGEYFKAYKQSKRKDDDIAIVNAAFRVSLDKSNQVKHADLVYGGMGPTTIIAKKASKCLYKLDFTKKTTLESVMNALELDFNLNFGVPGGMATYKKSLALGFFYRFYHEVLSKLRPESSLVDYGAILEIERVISTGQKDWRSITVQQQDIIGRAEPHVAALKQTCGEARYTGDIPGQKNELFGRLVLSTKAHAKIISVDHSPAFKIPGVVEWVDHTDMPSPEANYWGPVVHDEVFLAVDKVSTTGQPIGMILATSSQAAFLGSKSVKIEYEEMSAIFSIEEAIEKNSYYDYERFIKKGDTKQAFLKADHIFTGATRIGGQEHFYLETQACLAIPKLEDGEMEIHASTQNATET